MAHACDRRSMLRQEDPELEVNLDSETLTEKNNKTKLEAEPGDASL